MKNQYISIAIALAAVAFLSIQESKDQTIEAYNAEMEKLKFVNGAPEARTGAPDESNCTECHFGTTNDGTTLNNLEVFDGVTPVSNYTPGMSYDVSLSLTFGDVKEGFQATVLDDANNTMAGSFPGTGGVGTQITSGKDREYANHMVSSSLEGNVAWIWEWDAPLFDMGPITFYVATNLADGTGNTIGDAIYLSQHTFGSTASLDEIENSYNFKAGYAAATNVLTIDFEVLSVGRMSVNITDLSGKSVYSDDLGQSVIGENTELIDLPTSMNSGIYVVNFFIGNTPMSGKILVQK